MPVGDLHPSGRSPLNSGSCCQLLCCVKDPCSNLRIPVRGEVDVVAVRDLPQASEPVFLGVWTLSETMHDVEDFVVCDAG